MITDRGIGVSADEQYYTKVKQYLETNRVDIPVRCVDYDFADRDINDVVSRNLTLLRKSLGYSQQQFANLLTISLSQYKKYESGNEIIRFDISQRISLKLGYPNLYLLEGSSYQQYLKIPSKILEFGKIWYFANSLQDDKFEQYCKILLAVFNLGTERLNLEPSGVTIEDFERAVEENENRGYVAIGDGIRAIRHYLDKSQEQLAELMGVSVNSYQGYESATQKPRFNLVVAAHYLAAIGVDPLNTMVGTHYVKIRKMQNYRLHVLQNIFQGYDREKINQFIPVVEGFFKSISELPNSQYYPLDPHSDLKRSS